MSDPVPTTRDAPRDHIHPTNRETPVGLTSSATRRDETAPLTVSRSGRGGLPDAVLADYVPEGTLSAGGEAQRVMLVRDRRDGARRVVKVYGTAVRPNPALLTVLSGTDPDHLVQVLNWGEETDEFGVSTCWEVMEYVEYGSLRTLLAEEGPVLAPVRVREVVAEVSAALRYLHNRAVGGSVGLAHRDIKPENILVRRTRPLDLLLCDFGLVAEIRATRNNSRAAGTLAYQAPETWFRKSQEPSQDWWSLGVMVVELLTGRNPNTGVGGVVPDDRLVYEQIATRGVDLGGITDERHLLLCRGLLHRAPEQRWGADEVAAWLAGYSPHVAADDGSVDVGFPLRPAAPSFELAGRRCANPAEVAAAMAAEPAEARALFRDRDRQLNLSDWLREHFADVDVPVDLMRTPARNDHDARVRVARFISYVAPDVPPQYEGWPADVPGIMTACRAALSGDPVATRLVGELDPTLLRAFARHRCQVHPSCHAGPCTVLESMAGDLASARSALDDRVTMLRHELSAHPTSANVAERLNESAPQYRAALALGLFDDDYLNRLRQEIGGDRRAERCEWWRRLRDEAVPHPGWRAHAALVLAATLLPAAVEQAVTAEAEQAGLNGFETTVRETTLWETRAPAGELLLGLLTDAFNWLMGLTLAYLTTYVSLAVFFFFWQPDPSVGPDQRAAAVAEELVKTAATTQSILALPVAVLLAAALFRLARPSAGARAACWLCFGGAVAIALAKFNHHDSLIAFPIPAPAFIHGQLLRLDRVIGEWWWMVALVMIPVSISLGRRLVRRADAMPLGSPHPLTTTIRVIVVLAVVGLFVLGLRGVL